MRLLHFEDDGSLACTEFGRHNIPRYAILSHTWGHGEVTFQDLFYDTSKDLNGWKKILFCGRQAAEDGLKYFWIDTCCIDKKNGPELQKAINSMFRWYRNASRCYVLLSDVSIPENNGRAVYVTEYLKAFRTSQWFKRGWTLQELIAPASVEFFSAEGTFLGDRQFLETEITAITGIPVEAIRGEPLDNFSASERFAWAENRETTEEEDMAYCLLGIFDVFMPLMYGEGEENALTRLGRLVDESINDKTLGGMQETDSDSITTLNASRLSADDQKVADGPVTQEEEEMKMKEKEERKEYALGALGWNTLALRPGVKIHKSPRNMNPWNRAICLSGDVAQGANAGLIFQDSHVSFLNAVYWDEWPQFKAFADYEEMLADIRSHCKDSTHTSRLWLALESIESFSLRWQHFFEVVEFAMDIDPQWSSTIWGAIRLIFVGCKNFVNMFEKLAQMLDSIRRNLPSYHDHVLRLHDDCPKALKSHLAQALAFVYADILQFCQDVCMALNTSPSNSRTGPDLVKKLLSTPFSGRFEDTLHRLAEHQTLFDIELRAGRHNSLKTFISKVVQSVADREEFMQEDRARQYLEDEKATRDRSFIDTIHHWVQAPDFKVDFSKARNARIAGSCTWLHSEPIYTQWKAEIRTQKRDAAGSKGGEARPCPSILWLEGPPGYGKTILSTAVIEDLSRTTPAPDEKTGGQLQDGVAYFYFNIQVPGKQSYRDALRALVVQLVGTLRENTGLTDLVSILMTSDGKGQSMASDEDLLALLLLSVRRFRSLALILDGIDECQDFQKMWHFLSAVCADRKVKCLLLGRDSVSVPPKYAHLVQRRSLLGMNKEDIRKYLQHETEELQKTGLLQKRVTPASIARKLTSRANSSFLWANLMMCFLRNPTLDPSEREHEIENSGRLESLHSMYSGMLQQFESLVSSERTLLIKILQFLVLSKRPPSLQQLSVAISSKPGRKSTSYDTLDVADILGRLCGPLIDVGEDSTITFSHLSFRVFLLSEEAKQSRAPFRVDLKAGSLRLAVTCLSYLVNDLPQGPLSGLPDTTADKTDLVSQLPLSEYSARYWVDHAVDAIKLMPDTLHELISECYPLLQQLGLFLSQKASISVWIETCWTYNFQPSIETLWQELGRRIRQTTTRTQQNSTEWRTSRSLGQIQALSNNLEKLNEHWSHLLSMRPYEIWGSSISVFLGPLSWAHNDQAKVTVIASSEADEDMKETVLKVSQLSACGSYLGIVRLYRTSDKRSSNAKTRCIFKRERCRDGSAVDLRDVVATYQILEMKLDFPTATQFFIDLDPEDLRQVETTAEGDNFRFPIAFSPDLRCISILRTLFWEDCDGALQKQKLGTPIAHFVQKPKLDIPIVKSDQVSESETLLSSAPAPGAKRVAPPSPPDNDISSPSKRPATALTRADGKLRRLRRKSGQQIHRLLSLNPKPSASNPIMLETDSQWLEKRGKIVSEVVEEERLSQQTLSIKLNVFRIKFSPCGQYVGIADRQDDNNELIEGRWTLTVLKKEPTDASSAHDRPWRQIGTLRDVYGNFLYDGNFAFNPRFQQMAILERKDLNFYQTSIWNFGAPHKGKETTTMVYATGLRNLNFSPSGYGLFGDHFFYGILRTVRLERYLSDAVPISVLDMNLMGSRKSTKHDFDDDDSSMQLTLVGDNGHTTKSLNTVSLSSSNGVPEASTVRTYADGAVVLKRLTPYSEDEQCMLYLPKDMETRTSVSILSDTSDKGDKESSDVVRMVLVPNSQDESYTWGDPRNQQSASVVTRPVESIRPYKVPDVSQHRIAYKPAELSSLPNSGAQRLLALEEE